MPRARVAANVRRVPDAVLLLGFGEEKLAAGAKFIDEQIRAGRIRKVRYGRRVFVRRADLEAIVQEGTPNDRRP
jgi:hypothetical protein